MVETLIAHSKEITAGFLVVFAAFVIIDWYRNYKKGTGLYDKNDARISLTLGLISSVLRIILKGLTLKLWFLAYNHALLSIPVTLFSLIVLYLLHELMYYWFHRVNHISRYLWAIHVNHHSSPYFNYTTAARHAIFNVVLVDLCWVILPLIGFHPLLVIFVESISIMFTFFLHSENSFKLKYVNYIFNTPDLHGVHHGRNEQYLDKNFGNTLIIFDRIFGTFKKPDEKPIYGISKDIDLNNIWTVIFHEWQDIFQEYRSKKRWIPKLLKRKG